MQATAYDDMHTVFKLLNSVKMDRYYSNIKRSLIADMFLERQIEPSSLEKGFLKCILFIKPKRTTDLPF